MVTPVGVAKSKVLVVDDTAQNRALVAKTLRGEDCYDVVLAASGVEGLDAYERERPDCVLLDVLMPDLDGFAVCERIRAMPGGAEVPILFLTGLCDIETFERAQRAGGADFLTKPIRPAELVLRLQAALRLRRMGAELREQVDLVRHQRDELMRVQLQKDRLFAFLVHDLKGPVNAIGLAAQVLLRDDTLGPRPRRTAEHIRRATRQLLRLILDLLDVSRAEEGRLQPHLDVVDLQALVDEIFAVFAPMAAEVKVELRAELSREVARIRADAGLLWRVLENLLDNAIGHAPEGSAVTVAAAAAGDAIELSVADAGAGIPPELRERIFDKYVKAEGPEARSRGGRGLGLAFCRLAVEAHGGTIRVDPGAAGTLIRLALPRGLA